MKKSLLKTLSSLLLFILFFSGCKKVTEEELRSENPLAGKEESGQANTRTNDNDPGCRLKHLDYGTGFTLDFKYNNNGLASEVLMSWSDGYFEQHKIYYDRRNRIIRTRITSADLPVINYAYFHDGDRIVRATGYFEATNELWRDIFYIYNRKGQMINLDDVVQDVHMKYTYNSLGFNKHGEYYIGTELFLSYDYYFKTPNRNPFLAVPGVPFGFWDFSLPLWDSRWEDNDRITLYEEGSPTVVLETDPAKTTMITGPHNYLTSATKYDMISESYYTESMTYQNCGGGHENENDIVAPSAAKKAGPLSVKARLAKILSRPSKNSKQELKDLIRQYAGKLK